MPTTQELVCRRCKVAVHGEHRNGKLRVIRCPKCGVSVEGNAADRLYIELARYEMRKVFTKGRSGSVVKNGGVQITHTGRKPKDPGGPFIIK